jgi:hypothetical protein
MLRIYKEGGGKGSLGLEVERWEGVVREVGSEPIGPREMGDVEKKVSRHLLYFCTFPAQRTHGFVPSFMRVPLTLSSVGVNLQITL